MSLILSGTDGLSDVDGTAATPAIRGTDANTGIFFPAADTIAFAEGGAECARFDSSGNFGVGTSSPSGRLHAATTTNTAVNGAADAGYSLFRGTTNSSGGVFSVSGNSTGNGINYVVYNSTLTGYEPANYLASQHIWKLGSTEALRLNSSANLVLQGGTTTANGVGITFPATQSASTDANTLDDYEEGTWTPALLLATGSITFSTVSGGYVKIGKLVYIRANFSGSATISSPTGDLRLSGLPFTAGQVGAGSTTSYNMAAGAYSINLETLAGTTTAYIFNFANGTRSSAHSYILAGSNLTISACYEV